MVWRRVAPMPTPKVARAEVRPRRQRTQYSCMACSMAMCLTAHGVDADEDTVNEVMGAQPMRGAAWEQALACAQHYGMRATLTVPATLTQLKEWTDKGIPVMIAWNPEGREWSHASVVVDVVPDETHGFMVHVADPNIPDPEQTVRVVTKDEFYKKWYEKWPNYLVRRPAMAVEREITTDGRQVMASTRTASVKTAEEYDCLQDYRAGGLSKAEYYRCLQQAKAQARREREAEQKTRDANAKARYHYTIYAERNGLEDVTAWINRVVANHSGRNTSYAPYSISGNFNAPEDIRRKFYRTVYAEGMTLEERTEYSALLAKYPGLKATESNIKDTEDYVIDQFREALKAHQEAEEEAAAISDIATELARPYSVDPKYRRNWSHYTWADADYPDDWRWNYIDEDGVYVHVAAKMSRYSNKAEIDRGGVSFAVYKIPVDEVAKVRRDTDESQIKGRAEFVTRGFVRVKDPDEVIPRMMPHILKLKGERGFDDDDLVSQARALRERRRQEAEEAAMAKAKAEEEARLLRQRKTVVDSALAEKFSILDRLISGGYAQARDIAQEVKSVYEAGGKPTEDQLKALRNMMYRSRMKAEADHFRVASTDLESTWWGDDVGAHTAKVTDTVKIKKEDLPKHRHGPQFVQDVMRRPGGGTHHTREHDVSKGRTRQEKHKKNWTDREADAIASAWGVAGEET